MANPKTNIIDTIRQWLIPDRRHIELNIQRMQAAKRHRRVLRSHLRDALLISLAVLSAGFGLRGFIMPNHFIDGGVMGVSLLSNHATGVSLSLFIILLNLPFLALGYRQISKVFSFKSILAITALAVVIAFVPYPVITNDKLLVALFGGFFLGAGIGFAIRGGCVIDGTEVLAIYMSRRGALSVGDFILIFNIAIFSVAAYLLSMEVAMYSILTYLAASKTVDFLLDGIEEYTGVTIISTHSQQVSHMIKEKLGWGLTIYSGRRGFGKSGHSDLQVDIIFTVVTRLEVSRLTTEVSRIDPKAFIVMQSIRDTRGGMVKKRRLKEKDD